MLYFLVWLLGAIIPLLKPLIITNKKVSYLVIMFFSFVALASMNYNPNAGFLKDLSVGITFSVLIYLIISVFNNQTRNASRLNLSQELAGFSYTLYLVHYPLSNFILTWLISPFWPFGTTTLFIKVILAISVLIYAWTIASLTERHTDKMRKILSNLFYKRGLRQRKTQYQITDIK